MREAKAELFNLICNVDWICITTNGSITRNGRAVMGRGCALQARTRWPGIDQFLGKKITENGNVPNHLGWATAQKTLVSEQPSLGTKIWSFPVKHRWSESADIRLILNSAHLLVREAQDLEIEVAIPRPGCGNGHLNWEDVQGPLSKVLDDRFIIITNEET